ncbi:FAD-dependent oxidoreductase [Streptomyces sp. NPDC014889]|uniref:FAD-dependent oxidoreductase n=1 Tax=Streptomyces sp. NPDC014889 TaxID=3364928 RepID=UPI0036FBFCD7
MRILVSGAGVAGPVLAYWLTRQGLCVTVVERAPALRRTGGHAVDLFRPAMTVSEKMGVLPPVEERATGRRGRELDYHHRDVDRWLDQLGCTGRTPAFYFDAITQLRMDTWSQGRVMRTSWPENWHRRAATTNAPSPRMSA